MPKLHILNMSFDNDSFFDSTKAKKGKLITKFKSGDEFFRNKKIKRFDRNNVRSRKESFIFEK